MLRHRLPWIVIAGFVALCSYGSTFSGSFGKCEIERQQQHTSQNDSYFLESIGTFFICEGSWLDANSDLLTAIATIFIAGFTWTLWRSGEDAKRIAARSAEHFKVTERAYIKISHITPKPGDARQQSFMWVNDTEAFNFPYEVRNHGRTPARITAANTDHEVLDGGEKWSLPKDYWDPVAEIDRSEAFLVCDDKFITSGQGDLTPEDKRAVNGGKKILIILGFVDYIDQFDVRHRSGYGRQYVPGDRDRNNLVFPDQYPGLNYDRERLPGEGNDWN